MLINSESMVSMRDANQNFSRVARLADERGPVVILRNNKPSYILMPYQEANEMSHAPDELVDAYTKQWSDRYAEALQKLAN